MKIKSLVALSAISFLNIAFAAFPDKPIRLIVPFAAGGSTDLVVRAIADPLAKELGQPVIVENNGGQGGVLGTLDVRDADNDGYTLGIATVSSHATNPAFQNNIGYNPLQDFTYIANIAVVPGVIAVNSKFPAKNYKEFEEVLKNSRGKYSYASSGQGGMQHLLMEFYKSITKLSVNHVPYRGAGPALKDTADGKVDMVFDNFPSTYKYIQEGKMKPIAVAAPNRLKTIPDVPTLKELAKETGTSLDKVNRMAYYGIYGPEGISPEIVKKINTAMNKVLAKPETQEALDKLGATPDPLTPEQFSNFAKNEFKTYSDVIKSQNLVAR